MGSAAVATMDGRRARAARTRESLVSAALALIDSGDLRPTAAAIAARAGLSVRSVFQHFGDLEDLFLAVADRHTNRIASLYTGTEYEGDLASRIGAFVGHRARLYETISPIRRAAMLQEPFSSVVAARLELARSLHRLDLQRAFGAELEAARSRGDTALPEALSAVTAFVVWDEMRRLAGLDVPAATEAMQRMVAALFAPPSS
jgi:TetR/AcrR family transcriptional regulator of autoinduction and epiphytic fitness